MAGAVGMLGEDVPPQACAASLNFDEIAPAESPAQAANAIDGTAKATPAASAENAARFKTQLRTQSDLYSERTHNERVGFPVHSAFLHVLRGG